MTDIGLLKPADIEKKSFEIITEELKKTGVTVNGGSPVSDELFPETYEKILNMIKRCIHATADFDYAGSMWLSGDAVKRFTELIRGGTTIVTDTNMALAGINRKITSKYGCRTVCFMADDDVAKESADRGVTRAIVSMEHAMNLSGPVIFVIGNAPTALITLREHYDSGDYVPAFVIGVPVGFVNVVAAKEMIMSTEIPYIVNSGRKGGSTVAAAIVNALLYEMD